jgi:hypothetical protein
MILKNALILSDDIAGSSIVANQLLSDIGGLGSENGFLFGSNNARRSDCLWDGLKGISSLGLGNGLSMTGREYQDGEPKVQRSCEEGLGVCRKQSPGP